MNRLSVNENALMLCHPVIVEPPIDMKLFQHQEFSLILNRPNDLKVEFSSNATHQK